MDYLFASVLGVWAACSVLRFVRMYELASPFQRWRRWDWFRLVPVGAFFGPRPPEVEHWILVRDIAADGSVGPWTELCRVRPRRLWHTFWNPDKHVYKAKLSAARCLLRELGDACAPSRELPERAQLSEAYLLLLQFATRLPRLAKAQATQFGVLETHIVSKAVLRSVVSRVHGLHS